MQVNEIMTKRPKVVPQNHPVRDAAASMQARGVGLLPVVENGRCVGVVTDRDITTRVIAQGEDPQQMTVGQIMSSDVACCRSDDDVETVGKLMQERQVRRIVVTDGDGDVVGVVSLGDLAKQDAAHPGQVLKRVSEP